MSFEIKKILNKKVSNETVSAATADISKAKQVVLVDYTTTAAVTSLTLNSSMCKDGNWIVIKDSGGLAGTNYITIDTEGSETIDGQDTLVINTNYDWSILYSDGSNWFIIS